jgi:phosphodiesterase/alkaline phosphatase D-like protein
MTTAQPAPAEIEYAVGVGNVDHRSARLWARVPRGAKGGLTLVLLPETGGAISATWQPAISAASDFTTAVTYPDDFPGHADLRPVTRYGLRLQTAAGQVCGEGRFVTAPAGFDDTPERFCFAFSSCHQPFERTGEPSQDALDMLEASNRALVAEDARFLLLTGDQVYADEPPCLSVHGDDRTRSVLLDLPPEEIRRRYDQLYRRSWAVPGFLRLGAERACHFTLDDHEIVDNYGSREEHAGPAWQKVSGAALDAFFDYQGSRGWSAQAGRPAQLFRSISYGTIALFLTDVRSERRVLGDQGRVMSQTQMTAIEQFLAANRERHALFLVVAVPMFHVPGWLNALGNQVTSRAGDLHDRWSSPTLVWQRDWLLRLLADHRQALPQQQLVILSGDIHAGWAVSFAPPGGLPVHQLVSSALTNRSGSMAGTFSRVAIDLTRPLEQEIAGLTVKQIETERERPAKNPYGGLNLGFVEVIRRGPDRSDLRFKLIGQDPERPDHPLMVLDVGLPDPSPAAG